MDPYTHKSTGHLLRAPRQRFNGIYDTSNTLARYDETEMFQIWFVAMVAIAKAYIKCIRPSIGRVGGVGLWLTHIATGVSV